jgi:hypothetical protein
MGPMQPVDCLLVAVVAVGEGQWWRVQVMKLVVERAENRADNKKISELIKAKLSAAA